VEHVHLGLWIRDVICEKLLFGGHMIETFPESSEQQNGQESPLVVRHAKLGLALACAAIVGCVGFVLWSQVEPEDHQEPTVRPNRVLEMAARYAVGLKAFMELAGSWNAELTAPILQNLAKTSPKKQDMLRRLILKGWLTNEWPSESALAAVVESEAALKEDAVTLGQMKSASISITDDRWLKLKKRQGWMAELAKAQTLPMDDVARRLVMQQAMQTTMVMMAFGFLGFLATLCGLALFVLAILRWRDGRLKFTLSAITRPEAGLLLEGFAVYMVLFLILPNVSRFVFADMPRTFHYLIAFLALIAGFLWPLWRGMKRESWHVALGLQAGKGILREMVAGLLGWLACLPLLFLGMMAASWIVKLTGVSPEHPITDAFSGSLGVKMSAVILAVVWAPISEEMMFRGLLFPGLSAWLRSVFGALGGAFIFAVIHPQGWAGVPAIMALAMAFSLLRMWRQSLIAPMTAHALNNGILCVLLLSV
jgi:membrane protease YdiL (CAAX protease family)